MAFSYNPSPAELTAAGYTKLDGKVSLYSHSAFPGVLFKVVSTIEQALACGGIAASSPQRTVAYIGRAARAVYDRAQLGLLYLPSGMGVTKGGRAIPYGATNLTLNSVVYAVNAYAPIVFLDTAFVMGVLTKARDGLLYNVASGAVPTVTFNPAFPSTNAVPENSSHANRLMTPTANSQPVLVTLSAKGGFMRFAAPITLKEYVARGRDAILATIPQTVLETYTEAFDEQAALLTPDRIVHDQVTIYLGTSGKWRNVGNFGPHTGATSSTYNYGQWGMLNGTASPINSAPWTGNVPVCLACAMLDWVMTVPLPVAEYTLLLGSGQNPSLTLTAARGADDATNSFTATSVAQLKCKLTETQTEAPTSGVLSGMLILSAPSLVPGSDVLDLTAARNLTFEALDLTSKAIDNIPAEGMTEAQVQANATLMGGSFTKSQAARTFARQYVNQNAREIDTFIAAVDDSAKAKAS